jgi:serine/threonine protein kinase
MGEVYRARDTRLDRYVAIKLLPAHLSGRPDLRERLEREARAVSSLNHPHICTLFDVGEYEGAGFLAMEYLEGETLEARLERGPLPLDQALRCAIDIADALAAAHGAGMTHRDLKPGNVMLTKSGPKLLDFGLAKTQPSPALTSQSQTPTRATLTGEGTIMRISGSKGVVQYIAGRYCHINAYYVNFGGGPAGAAADIRQGFLSGLAADSRAKISVERPTLSVSHHRGARLGGCNVLLARSSRRMVEKKRDRNSSTLIRGVVR